MIVVCIDRTLFSDEVISKAVYWETNQYIVTRQLNGNAETLCFEPKPNCQEEENALKERFLTRLNDFKVQQIVNDETKDLRTILYIKAFANNDDFEEISE